MKNIFDNDQIKNGYGIDFLISFRCQHLLSLLFDMFIDRFSSCTIFPCCWIKKRNNKIFFFEKLIYLVDLIIIILMKF